MSAKPTLRSRQRGFSLVEVMISTVVALFATLAIFQSFAVSEGYRRSATSGGDASFSGAVGTYLMDQDLKVAGFGINTATYLGCQTSVADQGPPARNFTFTLAPVQITPGANAQTPDSITVVSSSTDMMPGPINLTTALTQATDNYVVSSAYGVTQGDVLLLAETGKACTVAGATNTPTSGPSNQSTIKHAVGGAYGRYNQAGGLGPNYSTNAVLMDMGPTPTVNTYYILNNNLVVDQLVSGQLVQPVASNVVQLKALYGKLDTANGLVDIWNTTAPATATDWANVLAIRIAVVARSAQPEKPDSSTHNCTTTTANPIVTWDDGSTTTLDISGTAPTGTSWTCYRYRVFHVTSSLRNLIWTPS